MRVPGVPHSCQHLVLSLFWVLAIIIDVYCCFNLHFPDEICETSFLILICHLYILSDEVSVMVIGPVFKLGCLFSYFFSSIVLSLFSITVFYQMCLLHIFSLSLLIVFYWHCFYIFFLILMKSSLSIISFMYLNFITIPKVIHVVSHIIFWDFYRFVFYILVYNSFWVNFCERYKVCV